MTGWGDATDFKGALKSVGEQKHLRANILSSSLLQAILLLSALVIKPLLQSTVGDGYNSKKASTGVAYILFHLLWLYPLCAASIYFTGLFNLRGATPSRARNAQVSVQDYTGLLSFVVRESYRASILLNCQSCLSWRT